MNAATRIFGVFLGAFVATTLVAATALAAPAMSRDEILCRAKSAVGFSYAWGGSCWCSSGCDPNYGCGKGSCSGSCPNCSHSGSYGADCSGLVNKVWQVPDGSATNACGHGPYVAASYRSSTSNWNVISRGDLKPGDVLASTSHVLIYDGGDPWGSMLTYEARGCSYGIVHNWRTCSSSYSAARRANLKECQQGCNGSKIVGSDCSEGDCAAFGATCVDDAKGVRCVNVFCPAQGAKKVCIDDSQIMDCNDGAPSTPGDCAAFAAYCSEAGASEARCVSVFCVSGPKEVPKAHDACLPTGQVAACGNNGAIGTLTDCPKEQTCVQVADGARCGLACDMDPKSGAESETFKDMPPGATGYDQALVLYEKGIASGCQSEPLMFCPDCETSRGAMVKWLVLAAGWPLETPAQPTFSDVSPDSYFYPYVETAYVHGLTKGCGNGNFCPSKPVNRKSAAVFLVRALGWEAPSPLPHSFDDVATDHANIIEIETLYAQCVTRGCNEGKSFCPDKLLTRAGAAILISRAFQLDGEDPCGGGEDPGSDDDTSTPSSSAWPDVNPSAGGATSPRRGSASDAGGCACALSRGMSGRGPWLLSMLLLGLLVRRCRARARRKGPPSTQT